MISKKPKNKWMKINWEGRKDLSQEVAFFAMSKILLFTKVMGMVFINTFTHKRLKATE
jgi:hypothetical protein